MRLSVVIALAATPTLAVDFVRDVRPIFEQHCYECHGAEKQKNGYRLDIRSIALTGGDHHAPSIVPGQSAESPLFRFISGEDRDISMPPKSKPKLSAAAINTLKRWIDEGAVWPEGVDVAKAEDKTDWWSFKPLPQGAGHREQGVDAFIWAKLAEKGLRPAPEADARTLIRRLYFDLTGLPPSPEEVAEFEEALKSEQPKGGTAPAASPPSPPSCLGNAYERLVDQLLASPRYGERWARHWLDVVHYGETHGYDKDRQRMNAWPYRDYVIRAFNNDKPYTRFIEEQIAGDVLHPGTTDGITALGLISAGPWDAIGHMEVPESKTDGKIARHLDRDDMVQNAIGTFCSLTVQCAQCHNHKFDPITQEDYYSLQAVFAALDRTEVEYYPDDQTQRTFETLTARKKAISEQIDTLEEPLIAKAGAEYAGLTRRIEGASEKFTNANARPDFGFHSAISKAQDVIKWVQVDLGQSRDIDKVVLRPCYDDFGGIGAGFGFPVRFKVECSDDPEFKNEVTLLWRKHDLSFMNDFPNPGLRAFETGGAADDGVKGRYVRVTAVKLAPRKDDFIFALAELQVFDQNGNNFAEGKAVSSLDSVEAPPRWRKTNLTDGIAPEARSQEDRKQLNAERTALMMAGASDNERQELKALRQQLQETNDDLAKLPPPGKVYAGAVHTGNGAFRGTGHEGGKPRAIHVLKRGDIKQPAQEVSPESIRALSEALRLSFKTQGDAETESARRAALAKWITDKNNALTWRSIVNRVWQHHFGRALVDTPNDFGRMGAKPSHPELLDWLALWFRDEAKGSLKALHKLIVMSETYRQSSPSTELADKVDAANTYLSHQNRRKLDAESIRDSILSASGKLDLTMGGPSFQDFVIDKPQHSPHYEYHLHDPEDPKSHRRSIYRFIVRSQQQPFMTVMDCADPSMRVDKRNESLSPLQALALMNNGLTVVMARHFAERVQKEKPAPDLAAQVRRAFAIALSRQPTNDELAPLIEYARSEGLENTCRVLLNLNEFNFVD